MFQSIILLKFHSNSEAYFSVISAVYTAVSCFLRQKEIVRIIPVEEQVDFMIMNDTSQMAMQIDPRSEVEPIAKEAD